MYLSYRTVIGMRMDADAQAAFRAFQDLAKENDTMAIFNLGYMYSRVRWEIEHYSGRAWVGLGACRAGCQCEVLFSWSTVHRSR